MAIAHVVTWRQFWSSPIRATFSGQIGISIGRAFPVPGRPSRAAMPLAKLGRASSWIHRSARCARSIWDRASLESGTI